MFCVTYNKPSPVPSEKQISFTTTSISQCKQLFSKAHSTCRNAETESLKSALLLEKLKIAKQLTKFPASYGTISRESTAICVGIQICSLLNYTATCLLSCCSKGSIEPLLKSTDWLEDWGQQEVQKCPQLRQFVLQWGAGEQQTVRSQVVCVQNLCQLAMMVFHAVTLINDHELPSQL